MPDPKMVKQNLGALKITFIYLVLGVLWILFSDKVAEAHAPDRGTLTIISVLKGWGFVIATTILLFWLIQSYTSELQEGDERFRKAFRAVPVGLAITRASDGAYIDANAAYSKITGFSLEELIGQTSLGLNIITPEQRQEYTHLMSLQGFIDSKEMLLKAKSGESHSVFGSMEIVELNHEICVLSTAIDVTDRKQTEESLRASEYNYRSILEQASDGIFIADASGKYIEVNPSGCAMLGYTRAELLEKKMSDLIPPEDLTTVPVRMGELKQGKVFLSERRLTRKDGTLLPVEISARMLSDGRFQGILRDITERKEAEKAVRESEEILRLATSAGHMGTWNKNFLREQLIWSAECKAIFGLAPETEMNDERFMQALHPEDRLTVDLTIREALEKQTDFKTEYRVIWPDGTIHWIAAQGRGYYAETGQAIRMTGVTFDITERKQAEEAHERLAAIVESSEDAIIGKTLEGVITSWNVGAMQLYGYTAREAIGRSLSFLIPPDRPNELSDILKWVKRGESIKHFETVRVRKDGVHINILLTASPTRDAAQQINGASVIARDITERIQAERAIRESEERLRLSMQAANQGLYDLNIQTGTAIVNDEYARMLGYDPQTFVETNAAWVERLHPDDQDSTAKAYADYVNGLTSEYRVEFRQKMNDGNWKWILSLGKIVEYDATGKPLRMLGTHTDISVRKQSEIRLAERNATLNAILESSSAPVFSLDRDYQYTSFNKAHAAVMQALYGARIEIGKSMLEYQIVEEDRKELLKNLKRVLLGEQVIESGYSGEPGRSRRFFEITHNPIREDSGEIIGASVFVSDITERKQAEEVIRQLNETLEERIAERTSQLESANKELEAFSYSVSHDLRSPLRGIDGWSLALLEDYGPLLDEHGQAHIQRVRAEAQRMGILIDDILNLSRITRAEMNKESVDLSAIAEAVAVRLQETQPEDRQVEFKIQKRLTVSGDPKLLEVVLTNLLGNAFKFTGKKQQARIEFGQTLIAGELAFYVRDNGAGFDMEYANKLFGAFQRMHRASEFPGTGIGLATVQRIIHRHGGSIWAASEMEQGATFYFTLQEKK